VGKLVRKALDRGCRLSDLPLEEFRAAHADLDEGVYRVLGVESAVAAFVSYGSTGPKCVEEQIAAWKARVATGSAAGGD
jgi:argininosuccinate lyase